tara:strand:+ start:360 stop:1088 length:729 start_codon:yes stop_codon:yes gene_type:complete
MGRYQGSMLGSLWSILNPILLLLIYTFVFSKVFNVRWGTSTDGDVLFAQMLFCGLIAHGLLSEILTSSPNLILSQPNYVTKVVFPLEILPIVALNSAVFGTLISMLILLYSLIIFNFELNWTVVLIPLVIAPLVVLCLGVGWILAAIGVFIRDVGQLTGFLSTILLFMSPILYPLEAVPEKYQPLLNYSPLTLIIGELRKVVILGQLPDWYSLGIYMGVAIAVCGFGFYLFQKLRSGFADVI